jgi:DNA repair exonuclease SbcCD ATPase subunit
MSKTSISSDTSPNLESGATDSPWQPSWWQWLILALSGTLEIERQIAWLKKSNEEARQRHELRMSELRKETEELRKNNDEARQSHELRMSELRKETEQVRKETEQLRKENERLAELELKLDAVLPKSVSN